MSFNIQVIFNAVNFNRKSHNWEFRRRTKGFRMQIGFESDLSDGRKAILPFRIHFIALVMLVFDHLISAHF